jgi:RHH-type proline utilization regulon transcriptional repressor/proline dehydrogenase/delta 1-pyrroline-5-carboxylate dehydrogenase
VYHLAGQNYYPGQYEFQCLHGMGEPLYEQVVGKVADGKLNRPCRIYAPVGTHETLLAYLVRRLLENGANTSFVNRIVDEKAPLDEIVADPIVRVRKLPQIPHPRIPLPHDLYGAARSNSSGIDLANEHRLASLSSALLASGHADWRARPMLGCAVGEGASQPVLNPADHRDVVGHVQNASVEDVVHAVEASLAAAPIWQATPAAERAAALERAADLMEAEIQPLIGILVREAGKTFANGIAEVREAVDFLRYYAAQVRADFANDSHRPLGAVVCISPWNFPLAIFTGQVAAALAAGNTVLAKPAEQTPLIAAQAVRILLQAGVPEGVVQLVPGEGAVVGDALVRDERVKGVMFTGSTEVAGLLARRLAGRLDAHGRPVPLIAETGGQNAMIVDSSALAEQVVTDVVTSAFDSAGQRCSALRVLCVQEDVAERILEMLKGAMAECRLGNTDNLDVDIGPVIDADAKAGIERHIQAMRAKGRRVHQIARAEGGAAGGDPMQRGTFVPPTLIELESLDELQREVFGPVLHVLRYRREELDALLEQINATGYGLTLGVHTRIDETIARVVDQAHAGNLYVNRNMVGAVVGVQPFGGEGLSGTGPKAGGPLYLHRLLATRPADGVSRTFARMDAHNPPDSQARESVQQRQERPLAALQAWAAQQGLDALVGHCETFAVLSQSGLIRTLPGPTGERNSYRLLARETVLGLADDEADRLCQLAAVLAVGSALLWADGEPARALHARLPPAVRARVRLVADWTADDERFDVVIHHGDGDQLRALCERVAQRPGPIVGVVGLAAGETAIPLERLLIERAVSVNTAAAGGNASLMTIG